MNRAGPAPDPGGVRLSSSDYIAAEIMDGLLDGRFRPGERLVEADLTRTYNVSRGSVREALQRLAAEGVVSLNLHRGAFIRALSQGELFDVLAVLEALCGLAARLAAGRIGRDGPRARLQAALRDFAEAGQGGAVALARDRFFAALALVAGNAELARLLPALQVQALLGDVDGAAAIAGPPGPIADAVLSGDADRAEAAVRNHFQTFAAHLRQSPAEGSGPA